MKSNGSDSRLIAGNTIATDIDFHKGKDLLFWTDSKGVYSQSLRGENSSRNAIIKKSTSEKPTSIAVDFINNKLYVLHSLKSEVDIFELDGTNKTTVLQRGLRDPRHIALDPYKGYMFIADSALVSSMEEIYRAEREYNRDYV